MLPRTQLVLFAMSAVGVWINFAVCGQTGVRPPLSTRLQMADVYDSKTNKPRPDVLKQHFVGEGRLKHEVAMRIVADAAALLRSEKCLLELPQPITGSIGVTGYKFGAMVPVVKVVL